jgi:hypothetical protein
LRYFKKDKGIPLKAIDNFKSLAQIRQSYLDLKFDDCEIYSMRDLYYHKISSKEIKRVSHIEWADEFEEYDLMQSHYFISIGKYTKDASKEIIQFSFDSLSDPNQGMIIE